MRILLVLAYIGCIFALSSWERPPSGPKLRHADKVAHAIEYGILGGLTAWAVPAGWPSRQRIVAAIAVGLGVGAADEAYQRTVPGRESSAADLAADLAGATLGALFRERGVRRARASARVPKA
jgi:VanZ family protein